MNIFRRELRAYWKNLFFWGLGMLALIWSSMVKYSTLKSTGQSISQLLLQFPKSIQAIFGLTGFDISTLKGYYGILFMYLVLMATIHAVMLGAGIIAKEERDKTSEFLFVRPISRFKVITAKLFAGLSSLIIFNLITLVSSILLVQIYGNGQMITDTILLLMLAMFILQLLFFCLGTFMAAIVKRPKSAASAATSVLLFCFALTFIINLNSDYDNLKYLTPFKYFDARNILADGHLDPTFVVLSAALTLVMLFVTYRAYTSKDLVD